MDSINQQQPEENHRDLTGTEAGKKIRQLAEKSGNCFFCTSIRTGQRFSTRPMAVQQVDEDGTCWFLSAKDSHKNSHIAQDPSVQLLFRGSDYSDFLTMYGKATVSDDPHMIRKLWNPILKTWFTEGENDPRISVIRFTPEDCYYWDTKHGQLVGFAKQVAGAIIGKTLDDSIEGSLNP
jgi:general stress protein 26